MKNKNQVRFVTIRANSINEEERSAEFVISNEGVDSFNTVFVNSGWDLERYNKNPVVTYQHDDHSSNPDLVIGTSEIRTEGSDLIGKIYFEDFEDNEVSKKVFKKVKNKILRGASIRANVIDGRMGDFEKGENPEVVYFTNMELVAWSIVTLPSNPDSLQRNQQDLTEFRTSLEPAKPAKEDDAKKMSSFEAQIIINKNSL
ncbi:prohead protease [Cellulophaga phage phi39:1]|uniref:prohead protease n=1 Tax=Cellulophaga phage phi39:1 TaxID=1327993 RepID=UPI000351F82D|nr:prohead protease [Cellulophaga phage phi39:1]AGO49126.1 prohead protease [Cellulophaga phage phi39:1]